MPRRRALGQADRARLRAPELRQPGPPDPADREQLDWLLRRHGIRLRKRLGQSFLVDPALRDRVLEAAGVEAGDEVLEVGAGAGTLTLPLASRCRRLVAVELDRRLAALLRGLLAGRANVEVLQADVLALDLGRLFPRGGEVVLGNIPYYLTGALLPRLLEPEPRPRRLSLVVQREVAKRWTAPTGWSLSSLAVQVFAVPRLELLLPAAAFQPPPRVDSALAVLEVRPRPALAVSDLPGFFRFAESVFQFRRKQLGGALARLTGAGGAEVAERLRGLGIEPSRRAETLSLEEWEALHGAFT